MAGMGCGKSGACYVGRVWHIAWGCGKLGAW